MAGAVKKRQNNNKRNSNNNGSEVAGGSVTQDFCWLLQGIEMFLLNNRKSQYIIGNHLVNRSLRCYVENRPLKVKGKETSWEAIAISK